jgi:hypothetical protein
MFCLRVCSRRLCALQLSTLYSQFVSPATQLLFIKTSNVDFRDMVQAACGVDQHGPAQEAKLARFDVVMPMFRGIPKSAHICFTG